MNINIDYSRAFDYENLFYLTCDKSRIGKFLVHYELYKKIINLQGAYVECGIFKGASFSRFAMFRNILENDVSRKLVGFDVFGKFPQTNFIPDLKKEKIILMKQENIVFQMYY